MTNKERRFTLRLSEEDYETLSQEAKKHRMCFSEYVRYRLLRTDWIEDESGNYIGNGTPNVSIAPGSLFYYEATAELVQLEHYIETLPRGIKNRDEMKGAVENLWHLLR